MKIWMEIEVEPKEYFEGYYGDNRDDTSTAEEVGAHIADGLGHSAGIGSISWWAPVPTAATIISTDGITPTESWYPDSADQDHMKANGIVGFAHGAGDIAPDLYTIEFDYLTAYALATGGTMANWDLDGNPAWWDMQRGEGGPWLKLPSGMWIGFATIDLEGLLTR